MPQLIWRAFDDFRQSLSIINLINSCNQFSALWQILVIVHLSEKGNYLAKLFCRRLDVEMLND